MNVSLPQLAPCLDGPSDHALGPHHFERLPPRLRAWVVIQLPA
jgi:hypothetical protein